MAEQYVQHVSPEGKPLDLFYEACDCGRRCANFEGDSRTYKSIEAIKTCEARKTAIKIAHAERRSFPLTSCPQKTRRPAHPMEL